LPLPVVTSDNLRTTPIHRDRSCKRLGLMDVTSDLFVGLGVKWVSLSMPSKLMAAPTINGAIRTF